MLLIHVSQEDVDTKEEEYYRTTKKNNNFWRDRIRKRKVYKGTHNNNQNARARAEYVVHKMV